MYLFSLISELIKDKHLNTDDEYCMQESYLLCIMFILY